MSGKSWAHTAACSSVDQESNNTQSLPLPPSPSSYFHKMFRTNLNSEFSTLLKMVCDVLRLLGCTVGARCNHTPHGFKSLASSGNQSKRYSIFGIHVATCSALRHYKHLFKITLTTSIKSMSCNKSGSFSLKDIWHFIQKQYTLTHAAVFHIHPKQRKQQQNLSKTEILYRQHMTL